MLKNLARSLDMAFDKHITTEMRDYCGENMLAIKLDGVELVVKDQGELFAVSRFRPARFEVNVDELAPSVSASRAAVARSMNSAMRDSGTETSCLIDTPS